YIDVLDHWLIKNNNLEWEEAMLSNVGNWTEINPSDKDKYENIYSYEILRLKDKRIFSSELTNLHFPFIKKSRQIQKDDTWLSLDEFKERHKELLGTKIDERMLNEEEILNKYKLFNFANLKS
ncbi:hypothetical protein AVCANL281_09280, partial [Campylobacter canadensis]|nr:hypothetical protein [Campylobacter canadensis]